MNWKWWFLVALLEIFWASLAFADKKEKEWPPMPKLDTLVGDTTGALVIQDSGLITTFGIYPVTGWGKTIYLDTSTFQKYGMVILFNPWEEDSRRHVEILSELRNKVENEWGFQIFLVASRMSIVSCQEHLSENKYPEWNCDIFIMPDFKEPRRSADSLKEALAKLKTAFPVYRLKQPLRLSALGKDFYHPTVLTIKDDYLMYIEPSEKGFMTKGNKTLMKMVFKLAFPAMIRGLEEDWQHLSSKGGDRR